MLSLHYPSEIYNPAKIDNKLKEYYSVPSPDLLLAKLHFIDQGTELCKQHGQGHTVIYKARQTPEIHASDSC